MQHIIGKPLTKATTLFYTSFKSEVCTQSYGLSKLQESQLWEFWDLGALEQNDIWVLVSWPCIEYIKGKVVAGPNLDHGEFCESVFTRDSFVHQSAPIMH